MVEIYSKSPARAISKVLLTKLKPIMVVKNALCFKTNSCFCGLQLDNNNDVLLVVFLLFFFRLKNYGHYAACCVPLNMKKTSE